MGGSERSRRRIDQGRRRGPDLPAARAQSPAQPAGDRVARRRRAGARHRRADRHGPTGRVRRLRHRFPQRLGTRLERRAQRRAPRPSSQLRRLRFPRATDRPLGAAGCGRWPSRVRLRHVQRRVHERPPGARRPRPHRRHRTRGRDGRHPGGRRCARSHSPDAGDHVPWRRRSHRALRRRPGRVPPGPVATPSRPGGRSHERCTGRADGRSGVCAWAPSAWPPTGPG